MHPILALMPEESVKQAFAIVVGGTLVGGLILATIVFTLRNLWKIYTKAGQAGWKVLIPFYHHVIYCRMAGLSSWWALFLLVLLIPHLGLLLFFAWWIWANIRLARRFGKGVGFGIGLAVPFVDFYFRLVLAEDQSVYDNNPSKV
jgi:hypothetical protein